MTSLLNSCYDCSGAIGFPSATGDDIVMNTTRAVHGPQGFNASCGSPCETCTGHPTTIAGFQAPYTTQSFYLKTRNLKKALRASSCAGYTPTCEDYERKKAVCTENCSGTTKPRITPFSQYGGGISPFVGAVTQKQHLKDIKRANSTMVRGAQMTASARLRTLRPRYTNTKINKNTAGSFIALNRYNPRPQNQTQGVQLSCCTTSVGANKRGNLRPSIQKTVVICQESCPQ